MPLPRLFAFQTSSHQLVQSAHIECDAELCNVAMWRRGGNITNIIVGNVRHINGRPFFFIFFNLYAIKLSRNNPRRTGELELASLPKAGAKKTQHCRGSPAVIVNIIDASTRLHMLLFFIVAIGNIIDVNIKLFIFFLLYLHQFSSLPSATSST